MSSPTIKTIAKAASVSTATVSKALNDMPDISEATKVRIRQIAKEQGYTINANARQLASGLSRLIGVVVPDIAEVSVAETYKAIARRIAGAGYTPHLGESGGDRRQEAECVRSMMQQRASAIVIIPAGGDFRHIDEIVRGSIPIIYTGGSVGNAAEYAVVCDDFQGGGMAARHFFRRGHRRSLVLTAGAAASGLHQRSRGFIDYMQRHRAEVSVRSAGGAPVDEELGRQFARSLAAEGAIPPALFATDDRIALGLMGELRRMGLRVPEDVSIVGYGDLPCSSLSLVELTSVRLPSAEMGICAGDMTVGALDGDGGSLRRMMLEPQLMRRKTVAALRAVNED